MDLQGLQTPLAASTISPGRVFRIVDVGSGQAIAEGASARAAVAVLAGIESIFDVWIFVSTPGRGTWRQLTPGEQRMLWNFRDRCPAP